MQVHRRAWKQERDSLLFFSPHAPRGHSVLARILFSFPFPPSPTGYVRIRLTSGAIIGVADRKCRVHTVPSKKPNEVILDQGADYYWDKLRHPRRHKLTRELSSLHGSRLEFQEMGDVFAILFEFFMNLPRNRDVV